MTDSITTDQDPLEGTDPSWDLNDDAFENAADRIRSSVQPIGGRQQGGLTKVLERYVPYKLQELKTTAREAVEAAAIHRATGELDVPTILGASAAGVGVPPVGRGIVSNLARDAASTRGAVSGIETTASKSPLSSSGASQAASNRQLYEFPTKPPRPFRDDYSGNVRTRAHGLLGTDIEGRPLTSRLVAGRMKPGGGDASLSPVEPGLVARDLTGERPELVPASDLDPGELGRFIVYKDANGQERYAIQVSNALKPADRLRVLGHETGHAIAHIAAGPDGIPIDGLQDELQRIYTAGRTGVDRTHDLLRPLDFGYKVQEEPAEYWAEAMRAYMRNPNYIKTVAPKTAAAIRAWVNTHPKVSKFIQFNSIAAGVGIKLVPVDHDPFDEEDAASLTPPK